MMTKPVEIQMSKRCGEKGGWKASLAGVLKKFNGAKRDGSVASAATRDKRQDVLYSGFKELRSLGYKLDDVRQFGGRHIGALVREWERRGLSASTIKNGISVFRTFSGWIGKAGMVEGTEKYVSTPEVARCSSVATESKGWSAHGVDITGKIAEVSAKDSVVGLQLELMWRFGLRAREAMQLRPHLADKGHFVAVNWGTKGGRDRVVPVVNDAQREVLDRAKAMVGKSASTIPSNKTLAQWKNHFYHVLRSVDITRANGFTSHGLRHERLQEVYTERTGKPSPVQGGDRSAVSRMDDRLARQEVAEIAGHSRESISTHYLGR